MNKKLFFTSFAFSLIFFFAKNCFSTCTTGKNQSNCCTHYLNDTTINRTIWTVDWSSDDIFLATGGVDSTLRIFFADSIRFLKDYKFNSWIHVVKWNPDNETLAVATLSDYIFLINVKTNKIIQLQGEGGSRAMAWNNQGTVLIVAGLDGIIKLWSMEGILLKTISREYNPDQVGRSFLSLDYHPFLDKFITTHFNIKIFDAEGIEEKAIEHKNEQAIVLCSRWHPSGSFFVVGDYGHNWEGENVPSLLHFWSSKGNYLKQIRGSKAEYRNITWNKSGTRLATASDKLRIWSKKGHLMHEGISLAHGKLWGIDWNSKSDRIVTTSEHGVIAVWDNKAGIIYSIQIMK